jgi:5-formyltetrahydrofolate cyclo-ligase
MSFFQRLRWPWISRKIQKEKTIVRNCIIQLLKNQKEEDRLRKSLEILKRLFATSEFQSSKTILFYASFAGEVETFEMMRRAQQLGKRIALPMILKEEKRIIPTVVHNLAEDLVFGPYGIPQPRLEKATALRPDEIDLLIVPGVAFDVANHRLGRGAGYYDRFLANIPRDTPSFGLAFDFQVVSCLPHQAHDVAVSRVIAN